MRQLLGRTEFLPSIDLVPMDLLLLQSDGRMVSDELRDLRRLRDTLIVAVTAHFSFNTTERAQASWCEGCIEKPMAPEVFAIVGQHILNAGWRATVASPNPS